MKNEKLKRVFFLVYVPIAIFLMEMVVKTLVHADVFSRGTIFTLLFSAAFGLICAIVAGIPRTLKGRWRAQAILLLIVTLILGTQAVYYNIFGVFATLYSATGATDVLQYWREALAGIWSSKWLLLPIFTPFAAWLIFGKRLTPEKRGGKKMFILLAGLFAAFQLVATFSVTASTAGVQSASYLYSRSFIPNLTVSNFGVLTTLRLDIKYLIFGDSKLEVLENLVSETPAEDEPAELPEVKEEPTEAPEETAPVMVEYGDNVLEIDFDALMENESDSTLLAMHEYFSGLTPTKKNEYTGMFAGKNLIWLCGEAFDTVALDETHTPTLYKLAHEGFVFENFYTPIWGVSTSDGEYVTTTGLIPKSGVWSYSRSSANYMPFAFGTMFSDLGYTAKAYHDHTYDYYDRDLSHPNMGYDYKGVGNGLEMTETWPESDLEMMEKTIPEYIEEDAFHVYYMTVSGHLYYNFYGNQMAMKHEEDVADLSYSESARAYIACNMELDQAVEYLIEQLDEAGILEDTVICLSGDHYPYGLDGEAFSELAGYEVDTNEELYRSTLILWCADMEEPVYVDKYCASLDVMPTLANLFGLDYDSRLVMGHDILSDYPALVEFSDRSWITERGFYDAVTDTFTPFGDAELPEGYAESVMATVNERFKRSAEILENDYYAKVFGAED